MGLFIRFWLAVGASIVLLAMSIIGNFIPLAVVGTILAIIVGLCAALAGCTVLASIVWGVVVALVVDFIIASIAAYDAVH